MLPALRQRLWRLPIAAPPSGLRKQWPYSFFYFGDGHALQGDGEVCGSGLETSMEVAFRFDLVKKKPIEWPRFEDAEHLMVAGSARPLSDALRIAFVELVHWLVAEHGFDTADAYQLVSQTAVVRVANMVDPLYTVVAKFPRRFLPGKTAAGTPGLRLSELAWMEADSVLTPERIVVLPLGAGSKEDGPHLPLRTDLIEAEYLADRLLASRPVALLPTLTYGHYSKMLEYPGTTSLGLTTLRDVVVQIARSIAAHGPRRFYVLNTGVRTADALAPAVEALAREGILMRFTDVTRAGKAVREAVRQQAFGSHADEIETSMILYMQPGAVRMERARADGARISDGPLTRDASNLGGHYSPSGVFGDPTLATWPKGEKVTGAVLADLIADVDALAKAPLPGGTPRSPLEPIGP